MLKHVKAEIVEITKQIDENGIEIYLITLTTNIPPNCTLGNCYIIMDKTHEKETN